MTRFITPIFWEPGQGFDPRAATLLSDPAKIRLDPVDHRIKLALDASFRYPTDTDLEARSPSSRPEAVRKLLMLQLDAATPTDPDGNAVTAVRLRLFDGVAERYWDGATWAMATDPDNHWNDEATVNQNIDQFDVATSREFAVAVNLTTSDDRFTPAVRSVLVLWEGEIDFVDDILTDSLVATLQEELDWAVDFALPPLPGASASIDLDDYTRETGLTLVGAEAVYDHTADPDHLIDLLAGFDAPTQVLTLSGPIVAGNQPFLRMRASVQVAWDTHRDFSELGKLPQIVLRDTENVNTSLYPAWATGSIVRKDTRAAVELPPAYRATYKVTMEVRTDRTREQARLQESIMRLLAAGPASEAGPFLRSRATDRRYRLFLTDEFNAIAPRTDFEDAGVRTHRVEFQIRDVALHLQLAIDRFMVETLDLKFAHVRSDDEQRALGQGAPLPHTPFESFDVT